MSAYLIADTAVHDPDAYEEYKTLARSVAEQHGARYLARGGELHVDDSDLWSPTRLVVVEFPDLEAARTFLASDDYAPAKSLRHQHADSTVVVVDGASAAPTYPDRRMEVQRAIAAEPGAIFDVLRRPDGHVQIDATGMLIAAEGEPVEQPGDRVTVHMDRDSLRDFDLGEYDVEVVMTVVDPGREIAWTVDGQMDPPMGQVYGYRLESIEGGTLVTSYYDWSNIHPQYEAVVERFFPIISATSLRATLGILARTVAPDRRRPAIDTV
mgnify:FL=1